MHRNKLIELRSSCRRQAVSLFDSLSLNSSLATGRILCRMIYHPLLHAFSPMIVVPDVRVTLCQQSVQEVGRAAKRLGGGFMQGCDDSRAANQLQEEQHTALQRESRLHNTLSCVLSQYPKPIMRQHARACEQSHRARARTETRIKSSAVSVGCVDESPFGARRR